MVERKTFLVKHKAARKPRIPGEVFAMEFHGMGFVWGRVVSDRCTTGPVYEEPRDPDPGIYLVYIYKHVTRALTPVPPLGVEHLLLPPLLTTAGGWTKGYYSHVAQLPLRDGEILPQHCFWRLSSRPQDRDGKWYFDEMGRTLPGPIEPCDEHVFMDFGFVEHLICKAMGIRSPFE